MCYYVVERHPMMTTLCKPGIDTNFANAIYFLIKVCIAIISNNMQKILILCLVISQGLFIQIIIQNHSP